MYEAGHECVTHGHIRSQRRVLLGNLHRKSGMYRLSEVKGGYKFESKATTVFILFPISIIKANVSSGSRHLNNCMGRYVSGYHEWLILCMDTYWGNARMKRLERLVIFLM